MCEGAERKSVLKKLQPLYAHAADSCRLAGQGRCLTRSAPACLSAAASGLFQLGMSQAVSVRASPG
eukprot:7978599-Lingulodinium_polyedra.AAC.1